MKRYLAYGVVLTILAPLLFALPATQEASADEKGPISVSLKDAPIREVLKHIGSHAGVTIALDVSLPADGVVTLEVENLSWLEVFERILGINGLTAEQHGPSLWVVRPRAAGEQVLLHQPRA